MVSFRQQRLGAGSKRRRLLSTEKNGVYRLESPMLSLPYCIVLAP